MCACPPTVSARIQSSDAPTQHIMRSLLVCLQPVVGLHPHERAIPHLIQIDSTWLCACTQTIHAVGFSLLGPAPQYLAPNHPQLHFNCCPVVWWRASVYFPGMHSNQLPSEWTLSISVLHLTFCGSCLQHTQYPLCWHVLCRQPQYFRYTSQMVSVLDLSHKTARAGLSMRLTPLWTVHAQDNSIL